MPISAKTLLWCVVALLLPAAILSAAPPVWDFSKPEPDWSLLRNAEAVRDGNALKITATAPDSSIINNSLAVDPQKFNAVRITYRAAGFANGTGPGQIYFASRNAPNFSAERYFRTPALDTSGKKQSLSVSVSDIPGGADLWSRAGTITALRLDLTDQCPGVIWLEKIEFFNRAAGAAADGFPDWPRQLQRRVGAVLPPLSRAPEPRNQPYFSGKMCNFPRRGEVSESACIRHSFTLDFKPVSAFLQFVADDFIEELYVNGRKIDGIWSRSWREPNTAEIGQYLTSGRNTLAVRYRNDGGLGGVLYDLVAIGPDKQCLTVCSGPDAEVAVKVSPQWMLPDDRDSEWSRPECRQGPPGAPWLGVKLPYNDFRPEKGAATAENWHIAVPENVADMKVAFTLAARPALEPNEVLTVSLVNRHGRILSSVCRPCGDWHPTDLGGGRQAFTISGFDLPRYGGAVEGRVELSVRRRTLKNNSHAFALPERPLPGAAPEVAVLRRGKDSIVTLNGKPFYPVGLTVFDYYDGADLTVRTGLNGADSPINICNARLGGHDEWWIGDDTYDFTVIDRQLGHLLENYPSAMISPWIWCQPGKWYEKKYPERMARDNRGGIFDYYVAAVTFSGEEYQRDAERAVKALGEYCEKYYGSRIAFYCLMGGVSCEWQGWDAHSLHKKKALHDYSVTARRDFKAYCGSRGVTLPDVPEYQERFAADGGLFRDPRRDLAAILYDEYYSESIASCINRLGRAVKAALNGRQKPVGTYYGYSLEYGDYAWCLNSAGHNALRRILNGDAVDFLFSPPSYTLRAIGEPSAEMKPFTSVQLHDKLTILEDDTRTNLTSPVGFGQTLTPEHTAAVLRRNFGMALARRTPLCLLPINDGLNFNAPQIAADLHAAARAGQYLYEQDRHSGVETVFVIDENSLKYLSPTNDRAALSEDYFRYNAGGRLTKVRPLAQKLTGALLSYQRNQLSSFGAGCDCILLEDVPLAVGQYKLWIFAGAFADSPALRAALTALAQENVTIVLLYGAGFITGESNSDCRSFADFLGIRLQAIAPGSTRLESGKRRFGAEAVSDPRFAVDDPRVTVLGRYVDGGAPGLVAGTFGKARLIFYGSPELDREFLARTLADAGGHLYTAPGDVFFAGYGVLVLHSRSAGRKKLFFPEATNVWDVFERKMVARNVGMYEFPMEALTTRVFLTGTELE